MEQLGLFGIDPAASPDVVEAPHVDLTTPCISHGYSHEFGYAQVTLDGRRDTAHRAVYRDTYGPIPPGMLVDHACNNRGCVNPLHLRLVTPAENVWNSAKRGRSRSGVTSSQYKGVSLQRRVNKWQVHLKANGRNRWVGNFDNEEDAARAYDKAARDAWGDRAYQNFPRTV
jgi:hypothetical protein